MQTAASEIGDGETKPNKLRMFSFERRLGRSSASLPRANKVLVPYYYFINDRTLAAQSRRAKEKQQSHARHRKTKRARVQVNYELRSSQLTKCATQIAK